MTDGTAAGTPPCRYLACSRSASPADRDDPTAAWPLCAVHRPFVRESLTAAGSRVAVREIEDDAGEVRLIVGPA